jgi:mannosyl-oligosaccharide glucosidase
VRSTVIWYNTLEGLGSLEVAGADTEETGIEGDVVFKGQTQELGDFEVRVTEGKGDHPQTGHPSYDDKPLDRTLVHSGQVPDEALWQVKAMLFAHMKGQIDVLVPKYGEENPPPPAQVYTIQHLPGRGNMHLVQKVFEGAFEFDVIFSSGSAPDHLGGPDRGNWLSHVELLDSLP